MTVLMPYISFHIFPFLFVTVLQVIVNYRKWISSKKHDRSLQIASTSHILLELKEENLFLPHL